MAIKKFAHIHALLHLERSTKLVYPCYITLLVMRNTFTSLSKYDAGLQPDKPARKLLRNVSASHRFSDFSISVYTESYRQCGKRFQIMFDFFRKISFFRYEKCAEKLTYYLEVDFSKVQNTRSKLLWKQLWLPILEKVKPIIIHISTNFYL